MSDQKRSSSRTLLVADNEDLAWTTLYSDYFFDMVAGSSLDRLPDRLNTSTIDAVVLNLSGDLNQGLALFDQLRKLVDSPVVVVSVHSDLEPAQAFMRAGAQEHLVKSTMSAELLERSLKLAVERHNAALAQNEKIARIRYLLEHSYDALIVVDPSWQITDWNSVAEATFGWKQDEIIGQNLWMIVPYHLQKQFMKRLILSVADWHGTNFKTSSEMSAETRSGRIFSAEFLIYQLDSGRPSGYCVFVRDISKQKQSNQELERLVHERTEMLTQNNEELRQFARIASHDLQEPLRAVQGFADLLVRSTKGKIDQDSEEFIGFIQDGTQRMSALIQAILAHAQISKTECIMLATDCNSVLNEVLRDLQDLIIKTRTSIDLEPLPEVAVERSQMVQLFQNLISNSIKYRSDQAPVITIAAKRTVNHWLFSFQDNGIGIEKQYAEKVFDMFSRLHSKGEYPGTGIGLAICKRIVTIHGGTIWVEGSLGQGSHFMFTLPAVKDKEEEKNAE